MEKGGESLGPVCLEVRKVRPASLQQPEETVRVDTSPGAGVTSPGPQPTCACRWARPRKSSQSPHCPASRGRSRDGRGSPALPGRGSGVGGASWQSCAVQSRKRKNENRRMNFYYNKAALCQSPGPRAARLPPPARKGLTPPRKLLPAQLLGPLSQSWGRRCEYTFG